MSENNIQKNRKLLKEWDENGNDGQGNNLF